MKITRLLVLTTVISFMSVGMARAALPGAHSDTVDDDIFLEGNYLSVGVSGSGSFGTASNAPAAFHTAAGGAPKLGLSIDQDGFDVGSAPTTGDFFLPGSPEERFVVGYRETSTNGTAFNFSNAERQNVTQVNQSVSVTNLSSGDTLKARWIGTTSNDTLKVTQDITFDVNKTYYKTEVTIENVSAETLYSVRYMRTFDPDQDSGVGGGSSTSNRVHSQFFDGSNSAVVSATGPQSGVPFLFISFDSRARVSNFGFANGDVFASNAYDFARSTGWTQFSDSAITICFELSEALAPGASETIKFYSSLDEDMDAVLDEVEQEELPAQDGWLTIQVTPTSGTWQLTAPPGYTGPTTGTGNLAAVSAVTGQYGVSYGALSGYVAPSNQTQFVTGGNTTLFAGVYLQISTNIGTPAGVSATEGTYTNRIRVIWQGVAGATGYEIWRSQTNDADAAGRIADIPENSPLLLRLSEGRAQQPVASFFRMTDGQAVRPYLTGNIYAYDDYAINPINAYYYWVRAKTANLISPMSYVGMGYAALDPNAAEGTADISVSDFVYLPVNVTNLSHAGTVSCRLANLGPDALNAAGVAFDFHMGSNDSALIWIGSAQSNLTLSAGGEELIILAPSAKRALTVRGDLSGVQQVKVVVRHLSALNDPNLTNNTTNAAGSVRIKTSGVNSPGRSLNDYDGDGKADGCLYQSALGRWYAELSGVRYGEGVWIGDVGIGWTPVPGDYDGDGLVDIAVWNNANGRWLVQYSSSGLWDECWLGGPDYTAAPCDWDGDTLTDPVVYREADGLWIGAASSLGYAIEYAWLGGSGYQAVIGDYDGDGKADPAIYDLETGYWAISSSADGYRLTTGIFGDSGYLPAVADYDGDGLADPAIYAPTTGYWQIMKSASLATSGSYTWWGGWAGNVNGWPVPADYDGDGKADFAVYHQDTGIWELFLSANGYQLVWGGFGGPEYQPVR